MQENFYNDKKCFSQQVFYKFGQVFSRHIFISDPIELVMYSQHKRPAIKTSNKKERNHDRQKMKWNKEKNYISRPVFSDYRWWVKMLTLKALSKMFNGSENGLGRHHYALQRFCASHVMDGQQQGKKWINITTTHLMCCTMFLFLFSASI